MDRYRIWIDAFDKQGNGIMKNIIDKDGKWCKYEEATKKLKHKDEMYEELYKTASEEMDKIKKILKTAREGLEYYADEENYKCGPAHDFIEYQIFNDGGQIAREILQKIYGAI